jgi:hypothetical protein
MSVRDPIPVCLPTGLAEAGIRKLCGVLNEAALRRTLRVGIPKQVKGTVELGVIRRHPYDPVTKENAGGTPAS